jgi:homeobox protein cut-like
MSDKEKKELVRKVDELSKERETRVKEVDGFKERLKQYADYDEVKRELDIMKVRFSGSHFSS